MVMLQVKVFWVVMPCNVVVGYLVSYQNATQHHNPEGLNLKYAI